MFNWFGRKPVQESKTKAADLTPNEKRLGIATTYLAHFAIFHDDFFNALEALNKKFLIEMPNSSPERRRFYDSSANLAISIERDGCMVQIICDELDKFVGPLEAALTVTGGTAQIKKVEEKAYFGKLLKDKKTYLIYVKLENSGEKPMITADLLRAKDA